jgi:hypothetical protein
LPAAKASAWWAFEEQEGLVDARPALAADEPQLGDPAHVAPVSGEIGERHQRAALARALDPERLAIGIGGVQVLVGDFDHRSPRLRQRGGSASMMLSLERCSLREAPQSTCGALRGLATLWSGLRWPYLLGADQNKIFAVHGEAHLELL